MMKTAKVQSVVLLKKKISKNLLIYGNFSIFAMYLSENDEFNEKIR